MMDEDNIRISEKTIGRLSLYRRILEQLSQEGQERVHSPVLAERSQCSAAQVRRDFMSISYYGNPARGYDIKELISAIDKFLDHPEGTSAVLVGIGNLGRAVLEYFKDRRPRLKIVAAFDQVAEKVNRDYHGTPSYAMENLRDIVVKDRIKVGIICVPATVSRHVAEQLIDVGITGILNFAPVKLSVPPHVYLEDVDLIMSLEKVAYFSRMPFFPDTSHNPKKQP